MRRTGPAGRRPGLLDLFVQGVPAQEGIVFLLLNALGHGLFVARGEIAGNGLPLLLGFGAFQGDDFLHGVKWVEGSEERAAPGWRNPKVLSYGDPPHGN